ncbi:uncharacterized protein LOC125038917 [Penaeus chinensis]|uniref:uncharacterized protein LOC125038917 n=1 Tax=Penaeus chinensis TaxID=139456 RepID=UPI001FB644CD|nr:uncharacterized protein LOC125038917 [Penaeus chinensis]
MQCKAIQMASPSTWSSPAWAQPSQPPVGSLRLSCDLKALLPASVLAGSAWAGDAGELWRYYSDADFASATTTRCCSDSVSSDEGGSGYDVTLSSTGCDDNNNDNSSANLNVTPDAPSAAFQQQEQGKGDTNNNTIAPDADWTESKSKNSSPRHRLVDEQGFIRRAACLCVDETESKVLLVSSKKDLCSWLVPGGGVEEGEEPAEAAVREAWEEAGVQGRVTRYLGVFETNHHSGRKKHRTAVFVVVVKQIHAQYPEAHLGRARQWFSFEEALIQLSRNRPVQSAYLQLMLASRLKVPPA